MQVQYKRKLNHSYMILYGKNQSPTYQLQMLQCNHPAGLLDLEVVETGELEQYWYDITGKQPLEAVLANGSIGVELLETILSELETIWTVLARFLLQEDDLLLSPEYIFLESGKEKLYFCYCLTKEPQEGNAVLNLMEYLLSKLNHDDMQAVKIGYEVYQKMVEGGGSFREILHEARMHKTEPLYQQKNGTTMEQIEEETKRTMQMNQEKRDTEIPFQRENQRVRYSNSRMLQSSDVQQQLNLESKLADVEEKKVELQEQKKQKWMPFWKKKKMETLEKMEQKTSFMRKFCKKEQDEILIQPTSYYEPQEERKTVFLGNYQREQCAVLHYVGEENRNDFLVDREEYLIGSRPDGVDGVLQDVTVSRIHARIVHRPDGYYIEDLNSLNGTKVNGKLLDFKEKVKLTMGDEICFANQRFQFNG